MGSSRLEKLCFAVNAVSNMKQPRVSLMERERETGREEEREKPERRRSGGRSASMTGIGMWEGDIFRREKKQKKEETKIYVPDDDCLDLTVAFHAKSIFCCCGSSHPINGCVSDA